jgi:hypothetical protein
MRLTTLTSVTAFRMLAGARMGRLADQWRRCGSAWRSGKSDRRQRPLPVSRCDHRSVGVPASLTSLATWHACQLSTLGRTDRRLHRRLPRRALGAALGGFLLRLARNLVRHAGKNHRIADIRRICRREFIRITEDPIARARSCPCRVSEWRSRRAGSQCHAQPNRDIAELGGRLARTVRHSFDRPACCRYPFRTRRST